MIHVCPCRLIRMTMVKLTTRSLLPCELSTSAIARRVSMMPPPTAGVRLQQETFVTCMLQLGAFCAQDAGQR
jgi:hypothetical protein